MVVSRNENGEPERYGDIVDSVKCTMGERGEKDGYNRKRNRESEKLYGSLKVTFTLSYCGAGG